MPTTPDGAGCVFPDGPIAWRDTIVVGEQVREDSRAMFPQFFRAIIRIDCTGQPAGDIARRWTVDSSRRVWTFELGEAQFEDGTPVTAPALADMWQTRMTDIQRRGLFTGISSFTAPDPRTLIVTFDTPQTVPRALAAPVVMTDHFKLIARLREPSASSAPLPVLEIRRTTDDQRDQVDAGLDLIVTRDPGTITYAERRGNFTAVPLGWDRTYALLVPGRPAAWMADTSAKFRQELARDAVSSAARGSEGPFWWESNPPRCGPFQATPFADSVIAYLEHDRTSRELAERLVVIAGMQGVRLRAVARPPRILDPGPIRDAASVMAIPRSPVFADGCEYGLADATVVPLVDTRGTAILRQGRVRIATDEDGGVRILPADSVGSR